MESKTSYGCIGLDLGLNLKYRRQAILHPLIFLNRLLQYFFSYRRFKKVLKISEMCVKFLCMYMKNDFMICVLNAGFYV